ncbi:MAG: prepilin-type N-terminal cleavage/methylation domain-containing protein [Elusimicrobium sp.]|jgi:prepilin-type N-terminal cleavage/methylation domain-containing protein|nr:prepilin-type N-terminal cleavage/methylation domain-containing protein [Elusimicrobium sp.]
MKNLKRGFTMMEMLVVFILIAVLAQVAIVTYRRAIQDSKNDHAKAILQEIAIANQRFRTDYPSVNILSGEIQDNAGTETCKINKFDSAGQPPRLLIYCGYLEDRKWSYYDYKFYVCGDDAGKCFGALAYMVAQKDAGDKYYQGGVNPYTCAYKTVGGLQGC